MTETIEELQAKLEKAEADLGVALDIGLRQEVKLDLLKAELARWKPLIEACESTLRALDSPRAYDLAAVASNLKAALKSREK